MHYNKIDEMKNFGSDFFAGIIAGVAVTITGHPFE